MPEVGFSTGALAKGDFASAVDLAVEAGVTVLELSALRTVELPALEAFVGVADLSTFTFIAVHAPADFEEAEEVDVVARLRRIVGAKPWPVVIHPDRICDFRLWADFGNQLCVENMDRRKADGRYVADFERIFGMLPAARFCLDIAHARQVDPSMTECHRLLRSYRNRLCHVHMSGVGTSSKHEGLSFAFSFAFKRFAAELPDGVPVVLESPVKPGDASAEVERAYGLLRPTEGA